MRTKARITKLDNALYRVEIFEIDGEKRQVNFETLVSGLEIDAQIIYDFISFFYQKQLKVLFDFTKN